MEQTFEVLTPGNIERQDWRPYPKICHRVGLWHVGFLPNNAMIVVAITKISWALDSLLESKMCKKSQLFTYKTKLVSETFAILSLVVEGWCYLRCGSISTNAENLYSQKADLRRT